MPPIPRRLHSSPLPPSSPTRLSSSTRHSSPLCVSSSSLQASDTPADNLHSSRDKRARSESDEEDEHATYRKKTKKDKTVRLHNQWGRTMARLFDAYTKPSTMFHLGLKFEKARDKRDNLQSFSKAQCMRYRSFDMLTAHIPTLDDQIGEWSDAIRETVATAMRVGQDGARSDDTSLLKRQVIEILRETDPLGAKGLTPDVKATRGFNHELTGRLLCPVNLDFDDPQVRDQLKSGEYKLSANESWPTFFYEDNTYNPDDGFDGLLRSELLVQCFKTVYFGRSAWNKPDGSSRSTRAPKARLAEMDTVTTRSIAYIATFVYQALSSRENNQKIGGPFELSTMYWNIVELLEDDDLQEESEGLLAWWNRRIFPNEASAKAVDNERVLDPIATLKAQKAAKKAARNALHDSTNH